MINLLDNAAEAAFEFIRLHVAWDHDVLRLEIRDDGLGLPPEVAAQVGTPFFTTKESKGMGLGLYLARMVLGRFGGTVSLENHPQGGAVTRVHLPLEKLRLGEKP